jgi:hypothetical protein
MAVFAARPLRRLKPAFFSCLTEPLNLFQQKRREFLSQTHFSHEGLIVRKRLLDIFVGSTMRKLRAEEIAACNAKAFR